MKRRATDYDVKCMLCGTEIGQVLNDTFKKHAGCSLSIPWKGGLPRCCHCGGSLYFDPIDVYQQMFDRAQLSRMLRHEAA